MGCRVPDNSDYRDLKEWLYRKKLSDTFIAPDPHTLNSLAGLSYTIHLMNVFVRVFDVHLPFSLPFKSFATLEGMTEEKMDTALVKLGANVVIFCCFRGLGDAGLSLHRPLCNLFILSQNLQSPFEEGAPLNIPVPFLSEFASAVEKITWTNCEISDDASSVIIPESEWEQVSEETPSWIEVPQTTTLTSLITSATSSVSSLFRIV